jgi:5-methylcytosine-specific restriction endonuclease McrA
MENFLEEKYTILKSCFEKDLVFEMWPINAKFTAEQLLYVISHKSYAMSRDLGIRGQTITHTLDIFWPYRPKNSSNKVCKYILNTHGHKLCGTCLTVKDLLDFNKDISNTDGLLDICRDCSIQKSRDYRINNKKASRESSLNNYYSHRNEYIARAIQYKTHRRFATPGWANLDKIKEIYDKCPPGYQVDHIIPLQGKLVSGLHVETNLQYLTKEENNRKSNKYNPLAECT